ncbi:MAG: hypothetical protein ACJAXJ_000331 [Colwellia sp.]|jgi:hypothetical protein|tara:strand:- start:4997 stop:5332 length:336 start_codon:yes stop_codon:yes gene_type:complete
MTLFANVSLLKTSKNTTTNLTTMKAIALMVFVLIFLTSVLAHADHLADQGTAAEQQDCHICNQGIHTPPELPKIQAIVVTRYNLFTAKVTAAEFTSSQFIQPLLRAPPLNQ